MIFPEKLKIGDKIGIISTARKITLDELDPAIKTIESWQLQVELGTNLFEVDNQFSGTIDQRSTDLQTMIDDDSINAILCARGGYGTVQIIDKINFYKLKNNPKWIVGYSDVTVLHSHLNKLGIASLHATMPINFEKNTPKTLESLRSALFGLGNLTEINHTDLNTFENFSAPKFEVPFYARYRLLTVTATIMTILWLILSLNFLFKTIKNR